MRAALSFRARLKLASMLERERGFPADSARVPPRIPRVSHDPTASHSAGLSVTDDLAWLVLGAPIALFGSSGASGVPVRRRAPRHRHNLHPQLVRDGLAPFSGPASRATGRAASRGPRSGPGIACQPCVACATQAPVRRRARRSLGRACSRPRRRPPPVDRFFTGDISVHARV